MRSLAVHAGSGAVTLEPALDGRPAVAASGSVNATQVDDEMVVHLSGATNATIGVPASVEAVVVEVGSGSLTVVGLTCPCRVRAGSADVAVDDLAGSLELTAESGTVEVRNPGPDVTVRSGSAEVVLLLRESQRLDVSSDSGEVLADLHPVDGGRYRVVTRSGSVGVRVPETADIEVDLRSESGDVFPDSVPNSGRAAASLEVVTGSGDITLVRTGPGLDEAADEA